MVDLGVQSDNRRDIVIPEVGKVALGCMARIAVGQRLALLMWPTKRDKLLRNDPVEVTVLHTLKILVLLGVEVVEIKEARLQALVYSVQAVQQGDFEAAGTVAGVTKARVGGNFAGDQRPVRLLGCLVQVYDLDKKLQVNN